MDTLYEPLAAILNEASFEMHYDKGDGPDRRVSAAELRAIYSRTEEQAVARTARLLAPPALLAQFVDAVRLALEPVIDPDTDRVGHAFPIDMNFDERSTVQAGGYCDQEFTSLLPDFARVLVQAAAIIGVGGTVRLLADWSRGQPVRLIGRGLLEYELRPGSRLNPYWVVGVGITEYRDLIPVGYVHVPGEGWVPSDAAEWEVQPKVNLTGGIGVRLLLTDHIFIAPEARIGVAPLLQTTIALGVGF